MQVLFNTAGMPDVVFEISIGKHKNYCAGCTSRMGMPAVPRTMSGARIVGRSIVHQRQQAIIMNAYEVGVLFPRKEGEGYEASTISTPGGGPCRRRRACETCPARSQMCGGSSRAMTSCAASWLACAALILMTATMRLMALP